MKIYEILGKKVKVEPSTRKNKQLMATLKSGKKYHFGDPLMPEYPGTKVIREKLRSGQDVKKDIEFEKKGIKQREKSKKKILKSLKGAENFTKKALKLKKPTAKLPSISSKAFLSSLAKRQGAMVTPIDPLRERYANPTQDNRSLFFKETFEAEKRKAFGGFL